MRLFLAVAVLMLAFVAYTEAQDETVEQKLAKFGEKVTELSKNLADKAKNTFETIHTSDTAQQIRSWWNEQVEKMKDRFQ